MHELAVCQGLLDQVTRIAHEHAAQRVDRIVLRIGPLSGIELPLLEQAFTLARAGTVAQDAELHTEAAAIRVHCETCGAETDAQINRLLCGECGDYHTRLVSGDEMLLVSLELVTDERDKGNKDSSFKIQDTSNEKTSTL